MTLQTREDVASVLDPVGMGQHEHSHCSAPSSSGFWPAYLYLQTCYPTVHHHLLSYEPLVADEGSITRQRSTASA